MRRSLVSRLGALLAIGLALALVPAGTSRAVSVPFRGGAADHFWDVSVAFCRDGMRVAAQEVVHADNSMGDDLPYSLVLSTTSTLITTPLPVKMIDMPGGPVHTLAHRTVAYPYAQPQVPGAAQSVVVERWEHGGSSAQDDGADNSDDDDSYVVSGTTANCTVATAPAFDSPPDTPGGLTLNVAPGTPIAVSLQASDDDALDTVALSAADLPAGAVFAPGAAANPATGTLSWTPAQPGSTVVHIIATDPTDRSSAYTVTINVGRLVFLPDIGR